MNAAIGANQDPSIEPIQPKFELTTVEGRTIRTADLQVKSDGQITLRGLTLDDRSSATATAPAHLDDLAQILPVPASDAPAVTAQRSPTSRAAETHSDSTAMVTLYPACGGQVVGRLLDPPPAGGGEGVVRAVVGDAQTLEFGFSALAAVRFGDGSDAARADLANRLAHRDTARDTLLIDAPEGVAAFNGSLERLGADGWTFRTSAREIKGDCSRTFAVVLAAGLTQPRRIEAVLHRADGAEWPGRIVSANADRVRYSVGGASPVDVPWRDVQRVAIRSARVAFLSDLPWTQSSSEGLFGAPWPIQRDRSTAGSPLSLGGRPVLRGVGMHACAQLVVAVPPGFDRFCATIGIDDAGSPRGSAVFRVRAGGRVIFDSGVLHAADKPRDVDVALGDSKELELQADFGDGLDLSAHADWGNARLVRGSGPSR